MPYCAKNNWLTCWGEIIELGVLHRSLLYFISSFCTILQSTSICCTQYWQIIHHDFVDMYVEKDLRDTPSPEISFPFPRVKWFLYLRSSTPAATVVIHGLKDTSVFGNGPPFPAAWATNTPAFTAERSAASKGFKKVVRVAVGGLLGPTERLRMSTPSWTAYK